MSTNIVTLADDDYDAATAPMVQRACELINQLGKSRAYMLPVVISVLEKYVDNPSQAFCATSAGPHRPHLRIHFSESSRSV